MLVGPSPHLSGQQVRDSLQKCYLMLAHFLPKLEPLCKFANMLKSSSLTPSAGLPASFLLMKIHLQIGPDRICENRILRQK